MGDRNPPLKPDEQYPLLMVDGSGDVSHVKFNQNVASPPCSVTCKQNSKYTWWPEIISACWMVLILCGLSFLVFHAMGMTFQRRQQFLIYNCQETKPASNVYYHQIVPRGSHIPFALYTEYLAYIAMKYPLLKFNVIFLVDDCVSSTTRGNRKYTTYRSWFDNYKLDEISKGAFTEFRRRNQNVNVTIVSLSKFMAKTPLKYKWRLIPQSQLSFYARVFSVWKNGGIGMDLRTFNNDFQNGLFVDSRIDAILTQHNDGINAAAYTKALSKIDSDETQAIFNMLNGIINHFLNETRAFFNMSLPFPLFSNDMPTLVRTHRNKRESVNNSEMVTVGESSNGSRYFYNIDNALNPTPKDDKKGKTESIDALTTATTAIEETTDVPNSITTTKANANTTDKGNSTGTQTHHMVLFYDISILSEMPTGLLSHIHKDKPTIAPESEPHLLSIDTEGTFIAASSKLHPLLGHITSTGYLGMLPKFLIHEALMTQCNGVFKEYLYCNNIYIL